MSTETATRLTTLGAEFHHAAKETVEAVRHIDEARKERILFLRRCSTENAARLAALKEEIRTLPEQIAKWDAEAARLESQTAEDLLRQALEPAPREPSPNRFDCESCGTGVSADEDGCCATCGQTCWQWVNGECVLAGGADPEEAEQPSMSCPSCKREYPDFDGAGVVFCDPKQGGCGFCRHVELKGQPLGDKTVMVCTTCWEVQEEEQPKPEPYRAGLPPERLRKVWAEWEENRNGRVSFRDDKYRFAIWQTDTWWTVDEVWKWGKYSFRPLGATWSRVEAMADEAEKPAHDGYLGFKVGARPIAIPPEHRDEVPMCDAGCKVFSDGWQHYRTCKYVAWMQGKDLPAEQAQAPTLLDLRTVRDESNHADPDVIMADADLFDAGESAATKAPLIRKGETFTVERKVSDHGKGPRVKVTREGQSQCYIGALQPAHVVPAPPAPTLLDLTKLPPGTVCEALGAIQRASMPSIIVAAGELFRTRKSDAVRDEMAMIESYSTSGLGYWVPALVPARVVREGGEQ